MKLLEKILEIQKGVDRFIKDSNGYGYKYVSGNQILSYIKQSKDELGLLLYPEIRNSNKEAISYTNDKGKSLNEVLVWGDMNYVWHDVASGDKLQVPFAYYGQQDDMSQSFGSALTYSERYFLLKFFGVPTDEEDPDFLKGKKVGKSSAKPTTKATTSTPKPQAKASDTDKPLSQYQQLKEACKSSTVTFEQVIESSEREYGTKYLNDLSPEQFNELLTYVVARPSNDEELPDIPPVKSGAFDRAKGQLEALNIKPPFDSQQASVYDGKVPF